MTKPRACKICNRIYESEDKCPNCGSKESTDSFKGRAIIIHPEKSELAQKLKVNKKGNYAIKTRWLFFKMNLKITGEKINSLFKRKEIELSIVANITPNKKETKKYLSEKLSAPIENIYIKKISGKFGSKDFKIIAHVYESKKDKEKILGKTEDKPINEEPKLEEKPADEQINDNEMINDKEKDEASGDEINDKID